jgi:hypothetical protein
MKTGRRLGQVPNCPIERSARHPNMCTCHSGTVLLSHVTKSHPAITCRRIKEGSSELQIN